MAAATSPRRRGPLFTTRHYKVMAALLRERWQNQAMDVGTMNCVIGDMVQLFSADNPKFRSDKFLTAIANRKAAS